MFTYSGRGALVTGAGGGIGLQVALDLLAEGVQVAALDLKPLPEAFNKFDDTSYKYAQLDITDLDAIRGFVDQAAEAFSGLSYLVSAAGLALFGRGDGPSADVDQAIYDITFGVNFYGAINCVKACIPHMKRSGNSAMVHVASIAGYRVMERIEEGDALDAYQTSKAALISQSKSWALQYAGEKIRSNTVCPGSVVTPMTKDIYDDPERIRAMEARTPLGMVAVPEDISYAVRFLLADEARFITGADLVADGGIAIRM